MKNNLYLSIFLSLISLAILFSEPLFSEEIEHLSSAADEDGRSPYDADGVKNGTVEWRGNATHIINGSYSVNNAQDPDKGMTLIIKSGATVKFAINSSNNAIACDLTHGSHIMIDGATFGKEGNGGFISGFGAPGSYIRRSTIQNIGIEYSGWMEISDCVFYHCSVIQVFHKKYPDP